MTRTILHDSTRYRFRRGIINDLSRIEAVSAACRKAEIEEAADENGIVGAAFLVDFFPGSPELHAPCSVAVALRRAEVT